MTLETTSAHLDDLDIIVTKLRLLGQNQYLQGAFMHLSEGGQILNSLYEEIRDKDKPVIQPPTEDTLVEFTEELLKDINNLSSNIRKDTDNEKFSNTSNVPSTVIYLMAWSKIKQAEMFVKVFFENAKAEKKELDEYTTKLKSAKKIVVIINEDMNHKLAEQMIKSIWPSIYEKEEVYFHNEWKPRISEYMKAPNVVFDSLHCDECLSKFDLNETIFYIVGFKQGQKLPVDLPKDAYYVGL